MQVLNSQQAFFMIPDNVVFVNLCYNEGYNAVFYIFLEIIGKMYILWKYETVKKQKIVAIMLILICIKESENDY